MSTKSVFNVVHGLEPWTVLRKYGVCHHGNTWTFAPSLVEVSVTADDLITGFKNYANDKSALREWAMFILAASNLISFDALEEDPRGDRLLEALWQAAFEEEVTLPH